MKSMLASAVGWVRQQRRARIVARLDRPRYVGAFVGVLAFGAGTGVAAAFDSAPLTHQPAIEARADDTVAEVVAHGAQTTVVVETEQIIIEPEFVTREDPYKVKGTTSVISRGKPGAATVSYTVTYQNGVEVSRVEAITVVTIEPIDEVIAEGTLTVPSNPKIAAESNRALGKEMAADRGWTGDEWACLDALWLKESNWRHKAENKSSGAYGIPQALPGTKMASAGADWKTNPATQIRWGLNYIKNRYGTPCDAWGHSAEKNWY